MVTKRDFLEMEASLWLNERSQNVAKGWLSTLCCWEAAVHTLDWSWKKVDVKLMMMMMICVSVEIKKFWLINFPIDEYNYEYFYFTREGR